MLRKINTWQLIHSSLQQKVAVMLLYVLESKGSSPGRQGFFMAVNAKGEMSGSLGGGIMEHKFVELAKSRLQQSDTATSVHKQIHDKSALKDQSGMICSGEQTIFLYTLKEEESDTIHAIVTSLQNNINGCLQLSQNGLSFTNNIPESNFTLDIKGENDFVFTEKTGYKNKLYIIGGGHCALAFSQLMSMMDFYIYLIDDRPGLNTIRQNQYVHEVVFVENYSELKNIVPDGNNIYITIMTFGYRSDDEALRALLYKKYKYLGLMGSRKKIEKLFATLRKEGVEKRILSNIHSPIGLQIRSQIPEEIAVSIAAEIIKIKNEAPY